MLLPRGGYTIVEVLIVLAISGVLLSSAVFLVGGLQGKTEFTQSMQDIQSKIQTEINSVRTGTFAFNSSYTCATGPDDRPTLAVSASASGGVNQQCIFLGKAFQVVAGQSKMYIYSVLGNRTYKIDPSGTTRAIVTNFEQASPTAAIAPAADLTQVYNFNSAAILLKSAQANGVAGESDLAGFYTNLQSSSGTTSSQSLFAKTYSLTSNSSSVITGVQNCIEQLSGCANLVLSKWDLCFDSSDKKQTAQLSITTNSTGVITQLNFVSC